ncbi:Gfo/Idh/MocA family protein [uncultured Helicobacter sp.]|uniref:Gfo/Idh/MocA family protein n=1 Tax=uncultured Helicobacter sp. TaxID=175537 RepID=UPI00375332AD
MLRCGVVGYGYWGVNVARTIESLECAELYALCEIESTRAKEALGAFPHLRIYEDFEEFLGDENIECVCIITPPHTHFALAKKAIESRKHLFVEKPLCMSYAHSQILYELADRHNVVLYCDHIFLHAPAVEYLKAHIADFGNIVSITARRINLGLFQSATDVVWDLAIHDLSIIDYLIGLDVRRVSVFRQKYLNYPNDAFAVLSLELTNNVIVMINVSWLSPIKVREITIGGSRQTAIYDETRSDKLRIYTSGVVLEQNLQTPALHQMMIKYRLGEVQTPEITKELALDRSIKAFVRLVEAKMRENTESRSVKNAQSVQNADSSVDKTDKAGNADGLGGLGEAAHQNTHNGTQSRLEIHKDAQSLLWGEAEYRAHTLRVMAVLERLREAR